MFFNTQFSKLIHRVTRKGCTNILTRQYIGAISTHGVKHDDAGKTQKGILGRSPIAFNRKLINLFTPVRHYQSLNDGKEPLTYNGPFADDIKKIPVAAVVMFLLSVIPMDDISYTLSLIFISVENLAYTQVVYMACMLSFFGGVRFGNTLPDDSSRKPNWINIGCSVIPPLIAWSAILMPMTLALDRVLVGHGVALVMDLLVAEFPNWYKVLRILLYVCMLSSLCSIYGMVLVKKNLTASKKDQNCWWMEDEAPFEEFFSCTDDCNDVDALTTE